MKKLILLLVLSIFLFSCDKDKSSLLPEFRSVSGTWDLQSISYDSAGVVKTISSPYNRLEISNNLNYQIFMNLVNPVENGTVKIVAQTKDKLILYFAANYPAYSSFAGSHVFGVTNVELVFLSEREMVIKTLNAAYEQYSDREIIFIR
jgi:hypothetical protein